MNRDDCFTCYRPLGDPWEAEDVPGVTSAPHVTPVMRHITCPPAVCIGCGRERPYVDLRLIDDLNDSAALTCRDVDQCAAAAGVVR